MTCQLLLSAHLSKEMFLVSSCVATTGADRRAATCSSLGWQRTYKAQIVCARPGGGRGRRGREARQRLAKHQLSVMIHFHYHGARVWMTGGERDRMDGSQLETVAKRDWGCFHANDGLFERTLSEKWHRELKQRSNPNLIWRQQAEKRLFSAGKKPSHAPWPLNMKLRLPLCQVIWSNPMSVVSTRRHWPLFHTRYVSLGQIRDTSGTGNRGRVQQ